VNRIASVARSEASVISPYRPPRSEPVPISKQWINSDYPLAPQHVRYTTPQPVKPVQQSTPAPKPEPKPSVAKRVVMGIGALLASVGTVAGLLSIAALGPVGLAVAAGAAVLGIVLIRSGSTMK